MHFLLSMKISYLARGLRIFCVFPSRQAAITDAIKEAPSANHEDEDVRVAFAEMMRHTGLCEVGTLYLFLASTLHPCLT